jgi:hypothetical protein
MDQFTPLLLRMARGTERSASCILGQKNWHFMVRGRGKKVGVGKPVGSWGTWDKFDVPEKGARNKRYPALTILKR